jgi:hypothetical protein
MKTRTLFGTLALSLLLASFVCGRQAHADVAIAGGLSVSGGISIAGGLVIHEEDSLPPPPPVIVPAPVIVEPTPPVILAPAPVVVVAPAPAVVVAPAPPPAAPPPKIVLKTPPLQPVFEKQVGFGLKLTSSFFGTDNDENDIFEPKGMGGAGLLLRLRLLPHFATEIGLDAYGGNGCDGEKRAEVPLTIGLMWMPVPYKWRFQFYTIGGMGASFAWVGEDPHQDHPKYLGGFLGIGMELKLGPQRNFALFADFRGFIRKRLNDRPDDPLVPDGGSCREGAYGKKICTDWEGGGVFNLGMILYF